ncbi:1-acyl-sn-glycerol-3-phosphate acyltransferase [Fulvivirga sedimenti]|uniref:1-acyl-sn-glycerol-3-phosphate acyltransferase n=1 Tax=Fulvivirga sedimenti TaxID=2879465 RepID=A0A9X1KXJ6_9BACT|nr:1-acyl-sn-glycerol-3-phosphate acyltransferase [Fulvivirga sedimenti]MCA6074818.1 1-acyl-sn-glycerol-3-phosphate acyltransferase [Fulvivirga sedimenti]MCA6075995.1 1-acyl-sn-glycerol-3-phosphate acyltransferase [Fulvivirga sedimenti]MCA6077123.1 1-acyl-sn-glycerol-3-phosphate acyltransferase [Fulvivirga sedimenti]
MVKAFFRFLFKIKGWKLAPGIPKDAHNCIMLAAPHTSNWDFIYAIAALDMLGIKVRFTIKKEFNRFPLGPMISSMGALWIDRSPRKAGEERPSMTEVMADFFNHEENLPLAVLVTAEGTRSRVTKWKTGFYHTALKAGVPLCLSYLDYRDKIAGIGLCFMPTGNIEEDMRIIMDFYADKSPRHPEKFTLDHRYR